MEKYTARECLNILLQQSGGRVCPERKSNTFNYSSKRLIPKLREEDLKEILIATQVQSVNVDVPILAILIAINDTFLRISQI